MTTKITTEWDAAPGTAAPTTIRRTRLEPVSWTRCQFGYAASGSVAAAAVS